jgi:hypothetical protein
MHFTFLFNLLRRGANNGNTILFAKEIHQANETTRTLSNIIVAPAWQYWNL